MGEGEWNRGGLLLLLLPVWVLLFDFDDDDIDEKFDIYDSGVDKDILLLLLLLFDEE